MASKADVVKQETMRWEQGQALNKPACHLMRFILLLDVIRSLVKVMIALSSLQEGTDGKPVPVPTSASQVWKLQQFMVLA